MNAMGGWRVLTWLWSSHLLSISMGVSIEIAQWPWSRYVALGPCDIVYGYSAICTNFVIVLEEHGSYTPLICVNMVKASIQVTKVSICKVHLINSVLDKVAAYLLYLVMAKVVPSSWYFRDLPM